MTDRPIARHQVEQDRQTDADARAEQVRPLETRTTASVGRLCEQCGGQLTGRKKRFCSDRCRMRSRRTEQARRIAACLSSMEEAITALKDELLNVTKVQ
jgi:hypothetical protein